MESTPEQIIRQVEQLLEQNEYQEINTILNDKLLSQYNNALLYAWRAKAYIEVGDLEKVFIYAQKAIDINPKSAVGYFMRGVVWSERKEYDKAIADFNEVIQLDPNIDKAYSNRGLAWSNKGENDKAFADYNEAIRVNSNYTIAYSNRGTIWFRRGEYDKAFADYNKAIELNPRYALAYSNRGSVWVNKKEYTAALADYNKAIELKQDEPDTYFNRGVVWSRTGEYDKALADYSEAIRLEPSYATAYMNKGDLLASRKEYNEAIIYYKRFVELINNPEDYYHQVALSKIEELKFKIENAWYDELDTIVDNIKQLLLFDDPCLTHYTSLSGAQAMILENSAFRLSEGAFLNDTSEGRELFRYLSFESTKRAAADETLEELFAERPFIGSFVADNKHNDLTLWRMYGKEAQAEARGCALTVYKTDFIDNIKKKISPIDITPGVQPRNEEQFTFYNVAYLSKETFIVPGKSNIIISQLNNLMIDLRDRVSVLTEEQSVNVVKLLNDIAYLFKSSEYQYENEVRLVVQGVGFVKKIDKKFIPPRVYIELIDIVPALNKITLGPKVERADEWAAAFNYHIKAQRKDREEKVDIIISHLPFK
ncbi:tetratricopeptide repeat protein [Spirosoma oryzicola]|uniref:tetratricopeptide repeat protein n=1 Tax=Spirosoma oryzicola TaxID=2898794 RepID=UPI001E544918|nr:tetratricopeptide repeat protein [Spirosoma oryzicola]UHG93361.1 tetratricopeptide repeat protein [Spirosoma oryzicola]